MDRKIKEAILSLRIERAYSKDKILELYLNEIYFGVGSYGVAAAALNFYGKEMHELTIADAALLAAMPKSPRNYDPFKQPKAALERRNLIIGQMFDTKFITKAEEDEALKQPLGVTFRPFGAHIFAAEYFAEQVRRTLVEKYGEEKLYGGGLSVRTTLDPNYQRYAKKALVNGLVRFDRKHGWRGPVVKIEIPGDDWGTPLGKVNALSDVAPWRLAVVLSADDATGLKVGLQPALLPNGQPGTDRVEGQIPLAGVEWIGAGGKKGKALSSLVHPGEVYYVAPLQDKAGAEIEGSWQLMQVPQIEGGIVVMDPHTGRVLAVVGGFSFAESQFDRAIQAKRQPGSAFKPFVYSAALDNGYTPSSVIIDAPISVEQIGQDAWKPENYSGKFYGPSTLRTGIEFSRNLMTVRLAQDLGMPLVTEYARRFGVYDDLLPVLSMSLGAGETTLLRLATGYAVIANGGHQVTATLIDRVQDRYGKTIWRHDNRECPGCDVTEDWHNQAEPELPDDRKQVIDPHTASQITSMMEGVVQRGTATIVKEVGVPVAGKTGTTNDERDAWFVGFTPDLVVGIFMGFDNPTPMGKEATGGLIAAPIARDFLKEALAGQPAVPFRVPPGIKLVKIDRKTGARAIAGDPDTIVEAFKPETDPPEPYSQIGQSAAVGSDQWSPLPGANIGSGTGGLY